jgi:uncharacterized protein
MQFEWDERKRQSNLQKHGIDFVDAIRIFQFDPLTFEDTRFDYDEPRFWAIGMLNGILTVVAHTYPNENTIRIISARRATKHEQRDFFA